MSRYDHSEAHSVACVHQNKYFTEFKGNEVMSLVRIARKTCTKGMYYKKHKQIKFACGLCTVKAISHLSLMPCSERRLREHR